MKFNELEHIIYCVLYDDNFQDVFRSEDFCFIKNSARKKFILFDWEYGDTSEYDYCDGENFVSHHKIAEQIAKDWDISVMPFNKNLMDRMRAFYPIQQKMAEDLTDKMIKDGSAYKVLERFGYRF